MSSDLQNIDPATIPIGEIPAMLAMLAALQTALAARLMTVPAQPEPAPDADDQLLTAIEAAAILRRSVKWVYRRASRLPFARKLDARSWAFSKKGLEKWIARQRV
jgi:predicted DNA-binding transcriptional regulator AlpA